MTSTNTSTISTTTAGAPLFLGLDCSTQSMSAVVLNAERRVVAEYSLRFSDARFARFNVTNGVRRDPQDPNRVLVPSLMLVDALDQILHELASHPEQFRMEDIVAVSGSAQQHTSAYWRRGFSLSDCVAHASTEQSLTSALETAQAFAMECGPSWMDSATVANCEALEAALPNGARQVAQISGSRAYPRFTGNQIAKFMQEEPEFVNKTGRISLASSMLTSLLVGAFTGIDESDGSGMNLLDLSTRKWSSELLQATAKQSGTANGEEILLGMLGDHVSPCHVPVGKIHAWFVRTFGFNSDCRIIPFSGDNPCTLAGIGLAKPGDVGISLGTSSTLMAVVPPLDTSCAKDEGHFFVNPVDPDTFMAMICYKNGAFAREYTRDRRAAESWDEFEKLLQQTEPGNDGVIGFFMTDPEITPLTLKPGYVAFDGNDTVTPLSELSAASEVRAIVESQCLSLRMHAERLGVHDAKRLIVTGGGSASLGLLQVLADVFNAPVLRLESQVNSAALGGAFRAHHGWVCAKGEASESSKASFVPYNVDEALALESLAMPRPDASQVYQSVLPRFEQLEAKMVEMLS